MPNTALAHAPPSPAVTRLSRLASLDDNAQRMLAEATRHGRTVSARRELVAEGQEIGAPKLILAGWAARVRVVRDGRRQLLSLMLPGDLIGLCGHQGPVATSAVLALTPVTYCAAPDAAGSPGLAEAYGVSRALDEAYLLAQVARLGRYSAQERLSDIFLELHERFTLAGLVRDGGFDLPLTQETLADALGLTPVHVNRVLQVLRRDREIEWRERRLTVLNPRRLAGTLGREPTRVSAAHA